MGGIVGRQRYHVLLYATHRRSSRSYSRDGRFGGSTMANWQSRDVIDILLVEDNPGDARLTKEAFKEGKLRNNLHVCADGLEALDFLRGRGKYTGATRPDLILLDLNLPRKDSRELLADIKADPKLKSIPVVVLTTSQAEQDIL